MLHNASGLIPKSCFGVCINQSSSCLQLFYSTSVFPWDNVAAPWGILTIPEKRHICLQKSQTIIMLTCLCAPKHLFLFSRAAQPYFDLLPCWIIHIKIQRHSSEKNSVCVSPTLDNCGSQFLILIIRPWFLGLSNLWSTRPNALNQSTHIALCPANMVISSLKNDYIISLLDYIICYIHILPLFWRLNRPCLGISYFHLHKKFQKKLNEFPDGMASEQGSLYSQSNILTTLLH